MSYRHNGTRMCVIPTQLFKDDVCHTDTAVRGCVSYRYRGTRMCVIPTQLFKDDVCHTDTAVRGCVSYRHSGTRMCVIPMQLFKDDVCHTDTAVRGCVSYRHSGTRMCVIPTQRYEDVCHTNAVVLVVRQLHAIGTGTGVRGSRVQHTQVAAVILSTLVVTCQHTAAMPTPASRAK